MAQRICSVSDCSSHLTPKSAKGMCPRHYQRWLRVGEAFRRCETCNVEVSATRRFCSDPCKPRCSVDECGQPIRKRGWCASHYSQWKRMGEVTPFSYKWAEGDALCRVCDAPCPGRRNYCSTNCQARHAQSKGKRPKTFTCRMCLRVLPTDRVGGKLTRSDTQWCSDCGRDSPDVARFKKYGVTRARYEAAMLAGCELCGRTDKTLHIDHDHACCPGRGGSGVTCGKCVRGFLCGPCNRGLGLFFDNPDALRRAAEYLDRSAP